MTAVELQNRADRLFGRETDLERLLERTERTGLTAIIGQAQIGKSWLLMELARRLDRETEPRCLVGLTRSPKGANDPLLQVVSDLYQRWLADAGAWEQLKAVWDQQRDGLLPAFARFVGKLSEKAARLVPILGELGGTAIRESLEGLVAATEDLRSGRLIVSRLEYTQAQELVSSVRNIAGRRIALAMDQWEETRELELQRNTFRDFLREPEQWPDCHILLGARIGGAGAELLRELEREFPGVAHVHMLGEMDLAEDVERRRLIAFLHTQPQLRAMENVDDSRVLDLVGGYPRVISRWVAEDAHETVHTFDGLERLAREANEFRYSDLEKLLVGLDGDRRKLAVRIALVPLVEDADAWRALRSVILADLNPNALDDLKLASILEETGSPNFGHPTRRDAARAFLDKRRREAVRAEAEELILALARSLPRDEDFAPYAVALGGMGEPAKQHKLPPLSVGLCDAALCLLNESRPATDALIEGARQVRRSREPKFALIFSVALFSGLCDRRAPNDLPRHDALLNELRALASVYPDDPQICGRLAAGLFVCTLIEDSAQGGRGRHAALHEEMREVARAQPDDRPMRGLLAKSLANQPHSTGVEGDLARCDASLDELRALAGAFPEDLVVREQLARGLFIALNDAKKSGDFARRDALLDELRTLSHAYLDDAAVRERLARGLGETLDYAETEDDRAHRDSLLDELRALTRAYPDDAAVREQLALGLATTQIYAKAEDDLFGRDALLDELRALTLAFPEDAAIREPLAICLVSTQTDAEAEGDFARRDALLDELRALARAFPDDAAVREELARGLLNTMNDAKSEDDLARRDGLLDELRALAPSLPR